MCSMKNDHLVIQPFGGRSHRSAWEPRRPAGRRAAFVPAGRTLHLVDVENLMGGPLAGPIALRSSLAAYRSLARVHPLDHIVVGVNPAMAIGVYEVWPTARLATRGGPDGADLALLAQVSDIEWTARRYDRVVIGSGDGIFAAAAAGLRAAGVEVIVVSRASSLSMNLAAMASVTLVLPTGPEALA
jgi:hypothetical protein